jgi:hypothetical protein
MSPTGALRGARSYLISDTYASRLPEVVALDLATQLSTLGN